MPIIAQSAMDESYPLVVIGTGFGSLFFLKKLLAQRRAPRRILVLEWGEAVSHQWQLDNWRNSPIDHETTFTRNPAEKPWLYTIALGGGTLCWAGQSPRFHPDDFRLHALYGRGRDWPISYDDLEPYYQEAEDIMLVAGANDMEAYPRSGRYPMPPHRFSTADEMMKAAQPGFHFPYPLARLSRPIGARPACCGSTTCELCPTDAKWSALNGMNDVLQDRRVEIVLGAKVQSLDLVNGVARAVRFKLGDAEHEVRADLVVLGANAIQSPFILMQSGYSHPALGRYLNEKLQVSYEAMLDGVEHFNGSSSVSGINFSLLHGPHRRQHAGVVLRFENPWPYPLRTEFGRWRQVLPLTLLIENEPLAEQRVEVGADGKPALFHDQDSAYSRDALDWANNGALAQVLAPLPIERLEMGAIAPTGFHVQGTIRMGADRTDSVVDANLVAHDIRNLIAVGTAVMPTCGSVNPSLTAAALSLRAAHRLGSST